MTDILQHFRYLIDSEFHYADEKGNTITLKEQQKSSECQFVVLKKGSYKTFTLELDKQNNIDIHPLLASIEKLKRKCDYIIFCQKNKTIYVLIIEMKSNNSTSWTQQTRVGEIISRYLIAMIENHLGWNISQNIEFRYILFNTKNGNQLKGRKKKKTCVKGFEYEKDHKHGFLFTRKPCNTIYPDIGIFLK